MDPRHQDFKFLLQKDLKNPGEIKGLKDERVRKEKIFMKREEKKKKSWIRC